MGAEYRKKSVLTPQQLQIAELLANPADTRTKQAKCDEVGIDNSTLWRWERTELFIKHIHELVDKYTDAAVPHAWTCLVQRMSKDTQAIKLFFELKNMYRERRELTGPDGQPLEANINMAYTAGMSKDAILALAKELDEDDDPEDYITLDGDDTED